MTNRANPTMPRREAIRRLSTGAGGAAALTAASGAGAACAPAQVEAAPDMGTRFRRLLAGPEPLICPGAFDVISARLIVHLGFESVLIGGSAGNAANFGVPDYGLASITEMIGVASRIAASVPVPVFADADDGGGSPLMISRATRGFERGGCAAVMIEDHVQAKHLGEGGILLDTDVMVDRLRAAADARSGGMVLVARCDAVSVGLSEQEAMDRAAAYVEAGADLLFFAGLAPERIGPVASYAGRPAIASVHDTPIEVLKENGVPLVLYAGQLLRLALGAMKQGLEDIRGGATWPNYAERTISGEDYQALIESPAWRDAAREYNLVNAEGRQIRG